MNHWTTEALEQHNNPPLMKMGWDDRQLKRLAKDSCRWTKNEEKDEEVQTPIKTRSNQSCMDTDTDTVLGMDTAIF